MPEASSSPDDIVYKATVDDKTKEFFDRFDARLKESATSSEKAFQKSEQAISGMGPKIGVIAGLVGGVVGTIATKAADQLLGMVNQVKAFISESANLAGRAQELSVVLDVIGKNAGYTRKEMAGFEKGLQETGISILESRDSLTKMIQSEMDLTKATDLARVAQDAAVVAGTNSSDAFQRILWGITTLQPEILKTMGLTVDFQGAMKKWADANKRTVESLTAVEKKTIAMNSVMQAGEGIAGAYEAAMGTPFKKLGSQVRYIQDLMVRFGEVFLEGWGEEIDFVNKKLREMKEWLEANQDTVKEWGHAFGLIVKDIIVVVEGLLDTLGKLPKFTTDAIYALLRLYLVNIQGIKGADKLLNESRSKLGEYFAQSVALTIGFVAGGIKAIVRLFTIAIDSGKSLVQSFVDLYQNVQKYGFTLKAVAETNAALTDRSRKLLLDILSIPEEVANAVNAGILAGSEFVGILDEVGTSADDSANKLNKLKDAAKAFNDSVQEAAKSLGALNTKMTEEAAKRALDATRKSIEDALKESWENEDLLRQHNKAVSDIMKNEGESQKQAAQALADAKLEIEKQYQRQLRDMQQRFEFDAQEFARSRDAIGFLRLARQHDFELQQAKQNKNDQLEDAADAEQKAKEQASKAAQEALQALAEKEQEAQEERDRAHERERQLQELHDQWAEEDRQKEYQKEYDKLAEHLTDLYNQWVDYYNKLTGLAAQQAAAGTNPGNAMTPGGTPSNMPGTNPYGGGTQINLPGHQGTVTVFGQGGQVSQLLAAPTLSTSAMLAPTGGYSVPQIPSVDMKGGQKSSNDISVHVDGYALDPYMQRVLTAALIEVERNRSG
jgi:hypothetical protein